MIRKGNRVNGIPYRVGKENYVRLERVDLQSKEIFEFKLQEVIANCPDILPFAELDSQLGRFTHLCRELNTNSGPIDNLLLGERGEIAIIETKLWRNSQSRREAFAQIIDYSSQLSKKSYKEFEKMIAERRKSKESLFDIYTKAFGEGYSEADLTDAVSQTLKQCSFLLLLVGDGIQYGVEDMKEFIDKSPGNLSTMGLVELRVYKLCDEYIFLPMLVQRTVEICRTVVELKDERMKAKIVTEGKEESSGDVKIITYEQQSIESILSKVETEKGIIAKNNLDYLFKCSQEKDFKIKLVKKEHYIQKIIPTSEGLKDYAFFELWDHFWAGRDRHLYELQVKISNLIPPEIITEYQEKVEMITSNQSWPKKIGVMGWISLDLSKDDMKVKIKELVDLASITYDKIITFYNNGNREGQ